jgi:AcrR family transcriptional regulator
MGMTPKGKLRPAEKGANPVRDRILSAAMRTFMEHGFARATTLEIATRAKVSKRELYRLVGDKEQILAACVAERGRRMRLPEGFPAPVDRSTLEAALRQYGIILLKELMEPDVLAVFRLGISESKRSPGIAASIDEQGHKPANAALESLLRMADSARLLASDDFASMIAHYRGLLLGDRMVYVLLGMVPPPTAREIERRAEQAARLFLVLHARSTRTVITK